MYLLIDFLTNLDKIIPHLLLKLKAKSTDIGRFDNAHVDPDAALS